MLILLLFIIFKREQISFWCSLNYFQAWLLYPYLPVFNLKFKEENHAYIHRIWKVEMFCFFFFLAVMFLKIVRLFFFVYNNCSTIIDQSLFLPIFITFNESVLSINANKQKSVVALSSYHVSFLTNLEACRFWESLSNYTYVAFYL